MSTKIYNAYRFVDCDLGAAVSLLQKFKTDVLRPMTAQLQAQRLARTAVAMMDKVHVGWASETQNYVSKAWEKQRENQKQVKQGGRSPDDDFSCDVSLITHRGQCYVIMYTEQTSYLEEWAKLPQVAEFSYWDNTDPPESVAKRDWALRKRVWNSIFSGSVHTPEEAGLTIKLMAVDGLGTWPSPEE